MKIRFWLTLLVMAIAFAVDTAAMVRLQIKHQMEWTLGSPGGIFTIAGHTGHQVHRDDPGLVVSIVRHVFERAGVKK